MNRTVDDCAAARSIREIGAMQKNQYVSKSPRRQAELRRRWNDVRRKGRVLSVLM